MPGLVAYFQQEFSDGGPVPKGVEPGLPLRITIDCFNGL
jgi:hypothetical protein